MPQQIAKPINNKMPSTERRGELGIVLFIDLPADEYSGGDRLGYNWFGG
ncbi:hypothetical protein [Cellvibrio fontiphilus]|uniref:Uncharacterized protein n=1 Tax=Cellvibrio fontiphilus TaxID=1815559 RepID=A0ABV7FDY7_9GAMM